MGARLCFSCSRGPGCASIQCMVAVVYSGVVSNDEIPLSGGTHGAVVRIGDTVRRQSRPGTKTVHALLRHFEQMGFAGAPRPLGFDQQGREILSFIPGDVAVWKRPAPLPDYVRSAPGLRPLRRDSSRASSNHSPVSRLRLQFQPARRRGVVVSGWGAHRRRSDLPQRSRAVEHRFPRRPAGRVHRLGWCGSRPSRMGSGLRAVSLRPASTR